MSESDPATNGSAAAASRAPSAVSTAGGGAGVPPLGVVIPTKNSRPYLAGHLEAMRKWQDLAQEIVVVDSYSTDGTIDFIKANLSHPQVSYLSHPPGLYQSWNHAIAHLTTQYTYIATVGDTIMRAGLARLRAVAESCQCDVVISKPAFRAVDGRALADISWPIDDIIASLQLAEPRRLHRLEAMTFALTHASGAMLGSCASNLFRTATLQRFPFPHDFGTAGDGAWGWMHAAEVVWGVTPEKFSTFLCHPTNATQEEKQSFRTARRSDTVLRASMELWRRSGVIRDQDLAPARWNELMACLTRYLDAKTAFDQNRRSKVPWILSPRAWRNRIRREHSAEQLHKLKQSALRCCRAPGVSKSW